MNLAVHDALLSFARRTPHEALVLLDADGRVMAWLGAAAALTGFDAAEVCGHPLPPPLVADGTPPTDTALTEWQLRHKDGRPVRVLACTIPVEDGADGLPVRRMLQWRALTTPAGGDRPGPGVAHDLRNHLGAIGNATAVIEMVAPDPRLARPLAVIRRQLEALAELADRLRNRPASPPAELPAPAASERPSGRAERDAAARPAREHAEAAPGTPRLGDDNPGARAPHDRPRGF